MLSEVLQAVVGHDRVVRVRKGGIVQCDPRRANGESAFSRFAPEAARLYLGMSTSPKSPHEPYLYRKLVGARFRLYRSQMLQVNTLWKALAEIYTMHSFAPFFTLEISAKNRQHFPGLNDLVSVFFMFLVKFCTFLFLFRFSLQMFDEFCPDFATNSRKE